MDSLTLLQRALPLAASKDPSAYDLRPAAVRQTGARILRLMTQTVAGSGLPVHLALQARWAPKNAAVAEVIRVALVLCADHELNVSAFTARCAASAGACPYDVVSAALATLKGGKHGGATERVAGLFREVEGGKRARAVLADRLRRGETIPGFGHPLYPDGDPRAGLLLGMCGNRFVGSLVRAGLQLLGERPNLDFGLVAVSRAYGLPDDAPLVLFALGRTVGWIGHAMEQYAAGDLIRPRARYVGRMP